MKRGWGDLPSELLLLIMSYMEAKDLARLADVNYHWRRVSEDDTLWKPLLIRDYELPKSTKIKNNRSWIDEYKTLKFESPVMLCEDLRDCALGVVDVSFSPDGRFFCTTAMDASFKIWTATTPTYLLHERCLSESLDWKQALYSQFSPDSKRLLVCGLKNSERGEVAVFSVNDEECEVHSVCRAPNNPSDFTCCCLATFLSASFLKLGSTMLGVNVGKSNGTFLTNDNSKINFSSVIGSSTTQIFLCSAVSPWDHVNEAFLCPILRLLNRHGGLCRLTALGRYIPPRLRGVVLLAEEARAENKTLTVKAGELAQNVREGATKEEVRNELRRRLEELSATSECSCIACMDSHEKSATEREIPLCYCGCHRDDDRLLIHAYGETDSTPPRAIAFKIVSGEMVARAARHRCSIDQEDRAERTRESRQDADDIEDQLSSILALFDLPDYVIDMQAYVMGLTLSLNHKFLFVNMVHGRYDPERTFSCVGEVRQINLESLSFDGSYFGHFARFTDRFQCSLGGHYLASPSLGGARVWSRDYNCLIAKLDHTHGASAVAVEPINGEMVVTADRTDGKIRIWRSKKFLKKLAARKVWG
ncbi:unnamed protein product [Enterobius vermicularis]|uniref:F-box domain-containing protein n=1 Tax=Enterobius vermicularis TaxID=51028 RepID=A0A0N4UW22_ENTVE|nr:unnamed protein product [Enterobius vermicularis]